MIRFSAKDLDGDDGLFELVGVAFQMLLYEEPEELTHALIAQEARARQDAFQLPERGLRIFTRDRHVSRIHLVFIGVQMY